MRMAVTVVLVTCCALASAPPRCGAEPMSLEDCIAYALAHHPRQRAATFRHQAALARVQQAGAPPQPALELESDLQGGLAELRDPGESRVGLSQTLELPGRRRARVRIAAEEAHAAACETAVARLDLVQEVEVAFYDLLLAERRLQLATQDSELTGRFLEMAGAGFDAGDLARVEVLRAEVEAGTASGSVRRATAELAKVRNRLSILLGEDPGTPLEIAGSLEQPLLALDEEPVLQARALASRPEMAALQASLAREGLVERQARRGPLPDLDLGVFRHHVTGAGSFWNLTLSVSLPLFQQRFRGELAEALATARALRAELEEAERGIRMEVAEARRTAATAREQAELYRKGILQRSEEVYEMLAFSYQLGEIGGAELIQARRSLLEARLACTDAEHAYAVALAALRRSLGELPHTTSKE